MLAAFTSTSHSPTSATTTTGTRQAPRTTDRSLPCACGTVSLHPGLRRPRPTCRLGTASSRDCRSEQASTWSSQTATSCMQVPMLAPLTLLPPHERLKQTVAPTNEHACCGGGAARWMGTAGSCRFLCFRDAAGHT